MKVCIKQSIAHLVKVWDDMASQHFLPLEIQTDTQDITVIPTYLPHKGSTGRRQLLSSSHNSWSMHRSDRDGGPYWRPLWKNTGTRPTTHLNRQYPRRTEDKASEGHASGILAFLNLIHRICHSKWHGDVPGQLEEYILQGKASYYIRLPLHSPRDIALHHILPGVTPYPLVGPCTTKDLSQITAKKQNLPWKQPQTFLAARRKEIPVGNEDRAIKTIDRLLKAFKQTGRKWRRPVNKIAEELQSHLATVARNKSRPMDRPREEGHVKLPPWFDKKCRRSRADVQAALDRGEYHLPTYKCLKIRQQRLARTKRRIFQAKRDEDLFELLHKFPKRFWANLKEHKDSLP